MTARLVQAISQVPSVEDHRPGVDGVTVRLITVDPDYYGMSRRCRPGPPVAAAVMQFWRAVLRYEPPRQP